MDNVCLHVPSRISLLAPAPPESIKVPSQHNKKAKSRTGNLSLRVSRLSWTRNYIYSTDCLHSAFGLYRVVSNPKRLSNLNFKCFQWCFFHRRENLIKNLLNFVRINFRLKATTKWAGFCVLKALVREANWRPLMTHNPHEFSVHVQNKC